MSLDQRDLHPYQRRVVEHIVNTPKCAVFLEMGLGKTVSTLTALNALQTQNRGQITLVVAPKRVALHTWDAEAEKWDHLRHLRFSKVLGTKKQRETALQTPADIYIINIDNLPWLLEQRGVASRFSTIVIDEYSVFKSHSTKRFKALKTHLAHHPSTRVVGLTGTPAPNSIADLWSQVYLLDGGLRLGKYVTHFREKYFYPLWGNGHIVYKWGLKPGAEEAIYRVISDICISMRAEDYLTLPPVRYVDIAVHLDGDELSDHKAFQREQVLELMSDDDTKETITASNAAVLSGKLRQWLGGALYTDEGGEYIETTRAKIERLREMMEEIHTPVIIVYEFRHELERLRQAFPKARTIDQRGVIDAWNRGEVSILLGHPASMGHGLNLQQGGHTIIWYTLTWSLEYYQQMNARLARQGQRERVTIYHLICPSTLDEKVVRALQGKEQGQNALMEALKAEIKTTI